MTFVWPMQLQPRGFIVSPVSLTPVCLWQSLFDADISQGEEEPENISTGFGVDSDLTSYLSSSRRAVDKRRPEALETVEMVAVDMTEKARQRWRLLWDPPNVID